jgi:O-antigen/teichoic acid export membrane protein
MTSIARGSALNLGTRAAAVGLGLLVALITARLGPAQQGAFALFTAVESVLVALGSGFGVAIARRLSHHGERPEALVGASVVACVVLGVVMGLGLVGFARVAGTGYASLALLALAAPVLLVTPNLAGLWLGRADMAGLAALTLAAPLLTLAGIALAALAGFGPSLLSVLSAWLAARVLVAAGALVAAARGGWLGRPEAARLHAEARFVAVIGLTNLVGLLNYKVDLFLVERFLGLSATGVYSIGVMVGELLWLVSSSVTTAAYARIGQPDAASAAALTLRAMHASVLMLAPLSPLLFGLAVFLLPPLLGPAYAPALPVLAMLLPGIVVYGAASALSAWFTNHAGRPWVPALLALSSLAINVVVSVVAIPLMGMIGAALATTVSYAVAVAVGMGLFARASGTPVRLLLRPNWQALAWRSARRA